MAILYQFVLRLAFGLALAMALTSSRHVTSGYFRNHLYVTLGLSVLAAIVAWRDWEQFAFAAPLVAAVGSYVGSVAWLYEKARLGKVFLGIVASAALLGACHATPSSDTTAAFVAVLWRLAPAAGGLVLGTTIAAMFLGHWYLNTPTMQLAPLRRLLLFMLAAVLFRIAVSGAGVGLWLTSDDAADSQLWFLALRWAAGLIGPLLLVWMTWKTLQIPNTQSATGILYVAVILTFTGELTAQLLSSATEYPL